MYSERRAFGRGAFVCFFREREILEKKGYVRVVL